VTTFVRPSPGPPGVTPPEPGPSGGAVEVGAVAPREASCASGAIGWPACSEDGSTRGFSRLMSV
jgi:hypothetical protein